MITATLIDRFLTRSKGQALREGTRYAREARVGDFVGSAGSATTLVRGRTGDFEVVLWPERGRLAHRCTCPSWRNPCKHEVAAAMVLRQSLAVDGGGSRRGARPAPAAASAGKEDAARAEAMRERIAAAQRESISLRPEDPPDLRAGSPSGFSYRVRLRGGVDGPHSCDCPDFEANRLHACKHTERVRLLLRRRRLSLPARHRSAAMRPGIYLSFGEVIEPRLFGTPAGKGSVALRRAFDGDGVPLRPLAREESELRRWLAGFGSWVEPEALAWLDRRIERRPVLPGGRIARLVPPLSLRPYPYQWTGAEFLARTGRALLADEMGLGKTVQALLAAAALHEASPPARRVTVVCPASLRGGWQEEIRRWLGEEAVLLEGPTRQRARVIAERPRWLITHYEQVLRDHGEHAAHPPDLLIIDEAQRAKGLRTRTARVLKSIDSRYLFALTGTPLENRLEDAYAIAQLIDQRLLPPLWQIDRDHFVRRKKGRRVLLYRNLGALRARLAPAFLRRRKEDVALELPERVRSVVMVPMHAAVEGTYEDVMGQVIRIASKKVILPADLERMQRLLVIARRCCNGPHMLGLDVAAREDRKVPKLAELEQALRDLCLGEERKAVVFSEWTDMTERVEALCRRLRLPAFHLRGAVPVKKRPALIRAFSETKGPAAFISTDAGGVGLNLQAADVVINLDLPWNPARLEQRVARVHRIGSRRTVQEILIVCKESVEERILHLHDTKRNVLENIWARHGEDVIAAPGGSGAFREMVQELLRTQGPAGQPVAESSRDAEAGPPGDGETRGSAPAGTARPEAAGEEHAAARSGLEVALPGSGTPLSETPSAGVNGSGRALVARGASPGAAEAPASDAPAAAAAAEAAEGSETPTGTVDAASLARAIAGIAPTLPPDHRKSLATVFRALAEALEG